MLKFFIRFKHESNKLSFETLCQLKICDSVTAVENNFLRRRYLYILNSIYLFLKYYLINKTFFTILRSVFLVCSLLRLLEFEKILFIVKNIL